MKELLEFLVKKIVRNPDDIMVEEQIPGEGYMNLALKVNSEDVGMVIGKKGIVIKSLKEICKVKGIKDRVRVNIEIINE